MKYIKNAKNKIEQALPERGLVNILQLSKKTGINVATVWYNLNRSDKVVKVLSGEKKHVYYIKKKCKWTAQEISTRLKTLADKMYQKFKNVVSQAHIWMQKTAKNLVFALTELKNTT